MAQDRPCCRELEGIAGKDEEKHRQLQEAAAAGRAHAERAARWAAHRALQHWVEEQELEGGGLLHRLSKGDGNRMEEPLFVTEAGELRQDLWAMVDVKAGPWRQLWKVKGGQEERARRYGMLLRKAEAQAEPEQEEKEPLTVACLKQATQGEPKKAKGTDGMGPADVRNLPEEGCEVLVDLSRSIEKAMQWPWQLLHNIMTLLPKTDGGSGMWHCCRGSSGHGASSGRRKRESGSRSARRPGTGLSQGTTASGRQCAEPSWTKHASSGEPAAAPRCWISRSSMIPLT